MAIRLGIFAIPTAAVVGLVLLLNGLDASTGIAAAALGVVAVAGGATLGYFADRLPELPPGEIELAEARWEDFKTRMEVQPRKPPRAAGHDAP